MTPPAPSSPPPSPGWLSQIDPLNFLLIAVPAALVLRYGLDAPALWVFIVSAVAIVPLAGLMGRATENLAETLGAGVGGLLNATFGNAAELIIALVALNKAGTNPEMFDIVKASLTGSILGNILLVLGASVVAGGLFYKKQTFNATAASMGATLLGLSAIGLLIPTLFSYVAESVPAVRTRQVETLSEEIAIILAGTYILSLLFSLRTHKHLFAGEEAELPTTGDGHQPEWSRGTSLLVLLVATVGVAVLSELLVGSVEHAAETVGMTRVFVGVIVVAIVGNAAEHSTAVLVAVKNKMDLAVNIAIGSSIQIALFVAPVLVFASWLMGHPHPLDLHFTPMEVVAVLVSIGVLALVSSDGETHWMEGVMLLAVYGMIGLAFYHLPEEVPLTPAEASARLNEKRVPERLTVELEVAGAVAAGGTVRLEADDEATGARPLAVVLTPEAIREANALGVGDPAAHYQGKTVRVTGILREVDGQPQIEVNDLRWLREVKRDEH